MVNKEFKISFFPLNIINFKESEQFEFISNEVNSEILFENTIQDRYKLKITLEYLNNTHLKNLEHMFPNQLSKFNCYFKVILSYDLEKEKSNLNVLNTISKIKKYLFLSLITSIGEKNKFFGINERFCEFKLNTKSLQGVFLPYKFFAFQNEFSSFNDYFVSSSNTNFNYNLKLEKHNIDKIKQKLNSILIDNKNIKESNLEVFLQLHTIDWVKEGIFYTALIILYTLWESIIFELDSINLSSHLKTNVQFKELGFKFKIARNIIAHPIGKNKIIRDSNNYIFKDKSNTVKLNIDDLEIVRQEIITQLNNFFQNKKGNQ